MTEWPPAGAPTPPFECSGLEAALTLARQLERAGWSFRNPTNPERTAWFNDARCSRGHTVTGIVVVSPEGTLYPFARCDAPGQELRHFLMLWPPYEYPEP